MKISRIFWELVWTSWCRIVCRSNVVVVVVNVGPHCLPSDPSCQFVCVKLTKQIAVLTDAVLWAAGRHYSWTQDNAALWGQPLCDWTHCQACRGINQMNDCCSSLPFICLLWASCVLIARVLGNFVLITDHRQFLWSNTWLCVCLCVFEQPLANKMIFDLFFSLSRANLKLEIIV